MENSNCKYSDVSYCRRNWKCG